MSDQTHPRDWDTVRVLELLARPRIAEIMAENGGDFRLVGRWVWAEFPDKPAARVRRFLSAIGFRWNRQRLAWQHRCGVHSVRARGSDPRFTYGAIPIGALREELCAAS